MFKLLLLSLTLPILAQAADKCTLIHVREAMEINREHVLLYKKDGNRDAVKALKKLIFLEYLMLPFSASLDRSVQELQDAGVGMWCEDLVPMNTLPAYRSYSEVPNTRFVAFDKSVEKALRKKLKSFNFENKDQLYSDIAEVIEQYLYDHKYNCLTRHFLEATARSLMLAEDHYNKAPEHLKDDVIKAEKKLMRQMANAIKFARSIDKKAAPVQAKGIPVICQEMPTIPWQ